MTITRDQWNALLVLLERGQRAGAYGITESGAVAFWSQLATQEVNKETEDFRKSEKVEDVINTESSV